MHSKSLFSTIICFLVLALSACSKPTQLETVMLEGKLSVVTRNSHSTYYEGKHGPTGFEYTLAKGFAEFLGVELDMRTVDTLPEIFDHLENDHAQLAAAGLTITPDRQQYLRFSIPNLEVHKVLVMSMKASKPRKIEDLYGKTIEVLRGSSHIALLEELKQTYPNLTWSETDRDIEDMLYAISEGKLDFAILDSIEFNFQQAYIPNLREGMRFDSVDYLAWAFTRNEEDTSLYDKAQEYLINIKVEGKLLEIVEKYFGHVEHLDYVGARTFNKHIKNRLPKYKPLFLEASEDVSIDWTLLAAIGYQESHWRARAISPTGVRGLMMLTQPTAREMGVKNRLDPEQSIEGGSKYIRKMINRIDDHIEEPDRTWFALAAYNVGLGHLNDARIITQDQGGNPDKWVDVKERLPLLRKRKYYKKTKYGYARGDEPVKYVQNIRRYYEVLEWLDKNEAESLIPEEDNVTPDTPDEELVLPRTPGIM